MGQRPQLDCEHATTAGFGFDHSPAHLHVCDSAAPNRLSPTPAMRRSNVKMRATVDGTCWPFDNLQPSRPKCCSVTPPSSPLALARLTSLAIEAAANFPQAPWGRDVHDALPSELGLGSLFRALRRSISRSRSACLRLMGMSRGLIKAAPAQWRALARWTRAAVSGSSGMARLMGSRPAAGPATMRSGRPRLASVLRPVEWALLRALRVASSYPPTGWGKTARKLLGMTAECQTASIAAKALLRSLRAHRAFADEANVSEILVKASGAAKGVARLAGFTLEVGTATRVAAAMAGGVEIGRQIHDVRLSKRGRRLATARLPWCWVSCCRGW